MFNALGLSLITGHALTAVRVALFLRNEPITNVDWVLEYWNGEDILSVERWDTPEGKYALHINLTALKNPGEEIYIPFSWWWDDAPTVVEAIRVIRSAPTLENINRSLRVTRIG